MDFRQKCFLIFKKGELKKDPTKAYDFMNAVSMDVEVFFEENNYRLDVYADIIVMSYSQAGSWGEIEKPLMQNLNDQKLVNKLTQKYEHQKAVADSKILTGKNHNSRVN